jgi:anti-anti-sigma regulatory factor
VNKVIVDLAEVNHINYQLLGRLARLVPLFRNQRGDVRFVGVTPYLQNIFVVAAPDIDLQSYQSLGEAALSFEDRSEAGQVMN